MKNIRMVLPSGKTLYPSNYQAKYGLGVVEHDNMDDVEAKDVTIASQEKEIQMGDGTSKYEILYATFSLSEEDFSAVRYLWDTTTTEDGAHRVSNGTDEITVNVDNTAPEITTNIEDGQEYHSGTIEVNAADAFSQEVRTTVLLDGKNITVPYDFRSLEMRAGEHTLYISASDQMGNTSAKEVKFTTPKESADIDTNILPENGTVVNGDPTLSIKATDPSGDTMSVAFKTGERYQLGDMNITSETGASSKSGTIGQDYDAASGNGFPYETFNIAVDDTVNENAVISVKWSGTSNNRKTFLYVYNTVTGGWDKLYTRIDTFTKADGTERQVYNMLFDYQGLPEGGLGYMRLMHFDLANGRVIVRTYSPSLNDYDAKETAEELKNDGNSYFVESASINGEEDFEVSFEALGIVPQTKILTTTDLDVNVYGDELIGQVDDVESGSEAQYTWTGAPDGVNGWYAEVTDANGGISRTGVQYLTVERDTIAPALTVPGETEIAVGDTFDPMTGVSAVDDKDGDLTTNVIVTGSVDTGKVGNYEITYSVSDAAGNKTEATRVINVKEKVGGDITPDGTTTPGGTDTSGKGTAVGGTNVGTNQTAKSVKTGDTANTGICWASGILAAVAAVVSALKLKKKKDK